VAWRVGVTTGGSRAGLSERFGRTVKSMYTLELEAEELQLLRSALGSYLQAFGHNEADLVRAARSLLAKLPEPVTSKAS
jgi:hypothetical protein